ncbi:cyclic nucleotide-binding-like protein [Umbelopsis sp. PMI_123]|nr:cyclic nucleotide-binding-like protein [Umbelopsis sp. PMI_123]
MASEFKFAPVETSTSYSDVLDKLEREIRRERPSDVLQFCANYFNGKLAEQREVFLSQTNLGPSDPSPQADQHPYAVANGHSSPTFKFAPPSRSSFSSDYPMDQSELEDEDDLDHEEEHDKFSTATVPSMPPPSAYNRGRRTSVSAESIAPSQNQDYVKTIIPKSNEQKSRILASIGNNFLFRNLDEEQYNDVVNAMAEKKVSSGTNVIEQGGVGDYFYVVESGTFDCFISKDGEAPIKVVSYEAGGSFGELALMYNAPRAATIVATSNAVLWALDRVTFRRILMENTSRKRRMYEAFLEEVPLLRSLKPYERHKIADALESVYYEDQDIIVSEGDIGDSFYIIESGEARVFRTGADGKQQEVNYLVRGGYFGELALLNDAPRIATVRANGRLKCATLGKKAFTRLLGPVLDILKRNSENYHAIINQHGTSGLTQSK